MSAHQRAKRKASIRTHSDKEPSDVRKCLSVFGEQTVLRLRAGVCEEITGLWVNPSHTQQRLNGTFTNFFFASFFLFGKEKS